MWIQHRFQGHCPQRVCPTGANSYCCILSWYFEVFVIFDQNIAQNNVGVCCTTFHQGDGERHFWPLFLTKNPISTVNSPYDFCLLDRMHFAMKRQRFKNVTAIQKACTDILKFMPANGHSSTSSRQNSIKICLEIVKRMYLSKRNK